MMESAHSSMPQTEDFDDPFASLDSTASPLSNATAEAPSSATTDNEDEDPWAVLAAAAGEEAPKPEQSQPASDPTPAAEIPQEEHTVSTSFAQGETFSMPQTQSPYHSGPIPIEGISLLGSQLQSQVGALTRTLSTKLQQVDAKHGITQKVSDARNNVNERYHITEKVQQFHTNVVKPAGDNVVEKVIPSVQQGWGALSSNVRKSVANFNQEKEDGAGVDSIDGERALNPEKGNTTWASISSKFNSTAAVLGEKAEVWKEGHMQWREEHLKKMEQERARGNPALDVKETFAGGINWVSQRFKKVQVENNHASPVKERSVVSTLMDMDSRQSESDGIPSSFFRESM